MTARASIEVEEPVLTGQAFRVVVVLESSSARLTRGVSVLLRGFTDLKSSSESDDQGYRVFGSWSAVLAEGERIEKGTNRFEATLSLPEDAPPSGAGVMEIVYDLSARVKMELPWVFDATALRRLAVARPPRRERPPPSPVTVSSVGQGSDALFVEVSLDDTTFAPGESIDGAFSLANITEKRVDAATVSLVPRTPGSVGSGEVSVFKSLVGVREGTPVAFSIPLPATAALSFASGMLAIEQAILVRVDGSAAECRLPVVIDTFPRRVGEVRKVPSVGRTRWRFAWRDEGTRAGLALEGRDLALHGTLAGVVDARVKPRGNGVRARLTWESLGVGLSIQPRGLWPGGVSLGDVDAAFARRFVARGHEPAQVVAALERDLREALLAFDEAQLDDEGAEVASSASARDPEALRSFLAAVEALAEAVVAAERRLPPPAWVTFDAAAAWRAFAAATNGRLHAGRMGITGALVEGDRIDVETRCDAHGRPESTRLTLVIDPPAERAPKLADGADQSLRRAVEHRDPAPSVEVRASAVLLEIAGGTADPASLREAMAELGRLSRRVRGETNRGPYR